MNKMRYFALGLVVIMMFSMVGYLFCSANKTDNIQLSESEKITSEIESVQNDLANMTEETEAVKEYDDSTTVEDYQEQYTEEVHIETSTETEAEVYTEEHPTNYYGRLCIPNAGIDVALYHGASSGITDRQDSANLFSMSVFDGLYISDHNNQEFAKLFNVTVGMSGYIRRADGTVFNIVCTDVLTGHNTGAYIVDEEGNTNFDAHFLMYTCRDHWTNILICLWKHC